MSGLPPDLPRSWPFSHPKPHDGNNPATAATLMGPTNAALPTMASPIQGATMASAGERSIGKPGPVDTRTSVATTVASPSSCRLGPPSSSDGVVLNGTSVPSRIDGRSSNTADVNISPSSVGTADAPTPAIPPTVARFAAMQRTMGSGTPSSPPVQPFSTAPTHVGVAPATATAVAAGTTTVVNNAGASPRATLQQAGTPRMMPTTGSGGMASYPIPGTMYQDSGSAGSVFGGGGFSAAGAARPTVQVPPQHALLAQAAVPSDVCPREPSGSPSPAPVAKSNSVEVAAGAQLGSAASGADDVSTKEAGDAKMKPPPERQRYSFSLLLNTVLYYRYY